MVKYLFEKKVKKISASFKQISIITLGLLIAGIAAKQADVIKESLSGNDVYLTYLAALFVFFGLLHVLGYFAIPWKRRAERISTTICMTYMNFTLALYITDRFFTDPNIVVPVILAIIPWIILVVPFKYFVTRLKFV